MNETVKLFWLSIIYDYHYREIVVMTGVNLPEVLDRIHAAQAGRLRYTPHGPRITRISALKPPTLTGAIDAKFSKMLDDVLALANNHQYSKA